MKVTGWETLSCDAGWRNYHFLKIETDQGIVGWSEFNEAFGSTGLATVVSRFADSIVGEDVWSHERNVIDLRRASLPSRYGMAAAAVAAIARLFGCAARRSGALERFVIDFSRGGYLRRRRLCHCLRHRLWLVAMGNQA